ncbi:MAG: sulfite exporter TauE/SafE family protein [Mycobacteriales bacterium]
MKVGPDLTALVLLATFGLAGGVGITALGPGGILATIGLFAFTGLSPATVAGTAIVTHIATGLLGSAAYWRSGQFRERATRRTAAILCGSAMLGTPIGVFINSMVSGRVFGILLAILVTALGALVFYRDRHPGVATEQVHPRRSALLLCGLGFAIATASGLFGVGGPLLTVPLLVALGVPVLSALAAAQAQAVVIASVGTAGYLIGGAISWPLAALVGVPELCGVLLGWRLAHATPARGLKYALIVALFALAPYLALHG